jgi:hypothetical protein
MANKRRICYPFTCGSPNVHSCGKGCSPLKKADLLIVAHYLISRLSHNQIPAMAKRHKIEVKKDSDSGQELLAKQVGNYDESELCRVLLEISLLDSAYRRTATDGEDTLLSVAKRYRVDVVRNVHFLG